MTVEADAVHFALEDYAKPLRRVGACAVDLIVLILLLAMIGTIAEFLLVPSDVYLHRPRTPEVQRQISKAIKPAQVPSVLIWLACCTAYHVPLRRTRGGTLGYRLMGIRLVDASGRTPSMRTLAKRFLIAIPFTMLLGATYLACRDRPRRQAIQDQWSATWAVRRRANPAGPARRSYQTKLLGTLMMAYVDLEPVEPASFPEALHVPA